MADETRAGDLGARYARALFDLAREREALDAVEADVAALKQVRAESADFRFLLASPAIAAEDKGKGLAAVAERAGFAPITRQFLAVLAGNRRTEALGAIVEAFERLAAAHRGLVSAEVVSAQPLSPEQSERLAAALRAALGKDPRIETRVDPALLGGLKVKVGSRLYDASLRAKLDSLKYALKRA